MNRYQKPIPWLQETMDILLEKVSHLEREIGRQRDEIARLQIEKADRRGPKPKTQNVSINSH